MEAKTARQIAESMRSEAARLLELADKIDPPAGAQQPPRANGRRKPTARRGRREGPVRGAVLDALADGAQLDIGALRQALDDRGVTTTSGNLHQALRREVPRMCALRLVNRSRARL